MGTRTYKVKGKCANCDWEGDLEFPWGKEVRPYSELAPWRECPNCGCKRAAKKPEPEGVVLSPSVEPGEYRARVYVEGGVRYWVLERISSWGSAT